MKKSPKIKPIDLPPDTGEEFEVIHSPELPEKPQKNESKESADPELEELLQELKEVEKDDPGWRGREKADIIRLKIKHHVENKEE